MHVLVLRLIELNLLLLWRRIINIVLDGLVHDDILRVKIMGVRIYLKFQSREFLEHILSPQIQLFPVLIHLKALNDLVFKLINNSLYVMNSYRLLICLHLFFLALKWV